MLFHRHHPLFENKHNPLKNKNLNEIKYITKGQNVFFLAEQRSRRFKKIYPVYKTGIINKKLCGDNIFRYGFRYFEKVMTGLMDEPAEDVKEIIQGRGLRELWQTFMTGNYYYCFKCQSQCPAVKVPLAPEVPLAPKVPVGT